MQPKVLVGCPTSDYHEYCIEEFSKAAKSLTYQNCDILIVDNSKDLSFFNRLKGLRFNVIKDEFKEKARDRIVSSRNLLREYAINNNYDYFFSLEQDIIPPTNVIEILLQSKKNIIAGVYFKPFNNQYIPIASQAIDERTFEELKKSSDPELKKRMEKNKITTYKDAGRQLTPEEVEEPQIIEIHEAGLGCVLMSKSVIEKVSFRYEPDLDGFDDTWFYQDARRVGFKAYLDTSIKCKHLILNKPWKWADLER